MNRQDRQGARTVSDLERKYNLQNFGNQFAEVLGIATDARNTAIAIEEKLQSEIDAVRTEISESQEGILLRSEFEAYQETLTAELALKVGKDDTDTLVSMLEAYADEIRLQSNVLVIDSELFSLSRNGAVTMVWGTLEEATINSASINKGSILDVVIMRGSISDATIRRGTIDSASIGNATITSGSITNANISNGIIENAEIKLGSIRDADIAKCHIGESYIGNVYFDKFTDRTDAQMRFTDLGMFLSETDGTTNYSCFVWENNDGNQTLRMRADNGKLFIETLSGHIGDLSVCGMSIREMYNKIQELSEGGGGNGGGDDVTETLTLAFNELTYTFTWNSITGATEYGIFIDGAEYDTKTATSYETSYDTFLAMFGEGDHPVYIVARDSDGNELATSNIIYITVESEEEEQEKLNLIESTDENGDIWVMWRAISGATNYIIRVYDSSNVAVTWGYTATTAKNMSDFNLEAGTYRVTVWAQNADGDDLVGEEITITISNEIAHIHNYVPETVVAKGVCSREVCECGDVKQTYCKDQVIEQRSGGGYRCSNCYQIYTTNGEWGSYYMFVACTGNSSASLTRRLEWTNLYGLTEAGEVYQYAVELYRDGQLVTMQYVNASDFTSGNVLLNITEWTATAGTYTATVGALTYKDGVRGFATTTFTRK